MTGNYWNWPTSTDSGPGRDLSDVSGNNANYYGTPFPIESPYYTTVVGEFQNSDGPYGTFDQAGNVSEWTEAIISGSYRGSRGGNFGGGYEMQASYRQYHPPSDGYSFAGIRVSEVRKTLYLNTINPTWGAITLEPDDPNSGAFHYPFGTNVTLRATPSEGRYFGGWTIYDPNHLGDANYATIDANMVTTISMNTDRHVDASFKCSSGLTPMFPLMAVGLGDFALLRRRR